MTVIAPSIACESHHYSRSRFSFFILFLLLLTVLFRLFYLQIIKTQLSHQAQSQQQRLMALPASRGSIFDRNGQVLAMSQKHYALKIIPSDIDNAQEFVEQIQPLINLSEEELAQKVNSTRKAVYAQRQLSFDQMKAIKDLNLAGISFDDESKRVYPQGALASHVLGFVGVDGFGLEGVERHLDLQLKGKQGYRKLIKDGRSREISAFEHATVYGRDGYNVFLTIDQTIQYITEREIKKVYEQFKPKSVSAIVMNPQTGEILSMANQPNYDPNDYRVATDAQKRNRCLTDMYEPGSTFKVVPISAALEQGYYSLDDKIYCEQGKYKVPGRRRALHDHKPHGWLSVSEVMQKSSNIGTVKIAQKMGPQKLYDSITRFGFGRLTGVDLPGESPGLLRPVSQWSKASMSALPMGQELSASPLQMLVAMSSMANGGKILRPYVIKELRNNDGRSIVKNNPQVFANVLSQQTAQQMKGMLASVISEEGTASKAAVAGVTVAGKTGTSQKYDFAEKAYSKRKYLASFIGFFPVENPQYCIGVFVDEPPYVHRYGGQTAAPVFQKIATSLWNQYGRA